VMKRDLYDRVIPALRPDVIIGISTDYVGRRPGSVYDESGQPNPTSGPEQYHRRVKDETDRSLRELEEHAGKVLMVEPVPATGPAKDPFKCLTRTRRADECRFVANEEPTPIEGIYRSLEDNDSVFVADFDRLACPFMPICDPVINGLLVRFDNSHLTPKYAITLAPAVTTVLEADRLVGG
jgi:hypothetical protein